MFFKFSTTHIYVLLFSTAHVYVLLFSTGHVYVLLFSTAHMYVLLFSIAHMYIMLFSTSQKYGLLFSTTHKYGLLSSITHKYGLLFSTIQKYVMLVSTTQKYVLLFSTTYKYVLLFSLLLTDIFAVKLWFICLNSRTIPHRCCTLLKSFLLEFPCTARLILRGCLLYCADLYACVHNYVHIRSKSQLLWAAVVLVFAQRFVSVQAGSLHDVCF